MPSAKRDNPLQTVLALAQRLNNVSLACKLSGVSRSNFYRMKKRAKSQKGEGRGRRHAVGPARNGIPEELEYLILVMTERHPTIPYSALAIRLQLDRINVTSAMVQLVWRKHGLTTRAARVKWMGTLRPGWLSAFEPVNVDRLPHDYEFADNPLSGDR